MTRHDHNEQRDRVAASVASTHHPDVYRKRFPSPATARAALRVNEALARLESGDDGVREEFLRARMELRAHVKTDISLMRKGSGDAA